MFCTLLWSAYHIAKLTRFAFGPGGGGLPYGRGGATFSSQAPVSPQPPAPSLGRGMGISVLESIMNNNYLYYMAKFVSGLYARNGAFWLVPWAGGTFLYSLLREIKLHTRAVDGLWWKKAVVCGCCWIGWLGISEQPWRKYICEADSSLWRKKFSAKLLQEQIASTVNCKALQGTTWCMALDLLCTKIYVWVEDPHLVTTGRLF